MSLVFRVLIVSKEDGALREFPAASLERIDEALDAWRDYLLDMRADAGDCHVQALALHPLTDTDTAKSFDAGINIYLALVVGSDILRTAARGCFVLVKMGKLLVVGVVHDRSGWRIGRIELGDGSLEQNGMSIPSWMHDYFSSQATRSMKSLGVVSEKQKAKIAAEIAKSGPSQRFREALWLDVHLYGWRALVARIRRQ